MRYIHTLEEKKFKEEKEKENELLRKFGVDEKIIQELYDYDREMFNKNRSFSQHEVYIETLPLNINHKLPLIVYDVPSIDTIDDVRNELCVIYPIQVVTGIDLESLEIILLRINGYTYKQISKKIGLSLGQVKLRIKKIREILKNCWLFSQFRWLVYVRGK